MAEVNILGVEDLGEGPLRVHVECVRVVQGYPLCGVVTYVKHRPEVELVDLPVYAHPTVQARRIVLEETRSTTAICV